jgi:two-component system phosphate regulon response regulator PhoB
MLRSAHTAVTPTMVNRRMGCVLVIDGDSQRRLALAAALGTEHHDVELTATAKIGLHVACAGRHPELVIVDAVLEDGTGAEVCAALRRGPTTAHVLVMVLSTLGSEVERIAAFESGADDYVTRPFSMRELLLRARALLRRLAPALPPAAVPAEMIDVGTVRIDRAARRVTADGVAVALTRRELDLLLHLVDARGRVLTREAIVADLWPGDSPSERVVDTTLKRLRSKVPALARHLRTVRGVGYELTSTDDAAADGA